MLTKPSVLFICGSLNQTKMMHQIAARMEDVDAYFTPYYADGLVHVLAQVGLLKASILGGRHHRETMQYFKEHQLPIDVRGNHRVYDLVVTCSDLIIRTTSAASVLCWCRKASRNQKDLSIC